MIYCMSDIHGEYDRYQKMLAQIQFCDHDTLYVIGDTIDRGKHGVEVVLDMMQHSNIVLLRGNHEQMCMDDLLYRIPEARARWQRNGGSHTRSNLLYKQTPVVRSHVLHYFRKAPISADLTVNGTNFHLVHAYPSDNEHDCLWTRPEPDSSAPLEHAIAIVGHTPTVFLTDKASEPLQIWHGNGIIDIDCGCGNQLEYRRLACLRLDDMAEFYV